MDKERARVVEIAAGRGGGGGMSEIVGAEGIVEEEGEEEGLGLDEKDSRRFGEAEGE